jgi:hypothetical protein
MANMSITSNDGALDAASAVLEVTATNPEYTQEPETKKRSVPSAEARSRRGTRQQSCGF